MTLKIIAKQLEDWSNSRDSQSLLPVLIRRLIWETLPYEKINDIDFPGYENVRRAGVDGRLNTDAGHAYIPIGNSIWEFGTSKDIERKAKEDLNKREKDADSQCTFIFVSSRNWANKAKWLETLPDNNWHAIKVVDASDLEQWLETCPSTSLWLSEQMGLSQIHLETPEKYLSNWLKETSPEFPISALLSNRSMQKEKLRKIITERNKGSSYAVYSDTRDESIAFISSVIIEIDTGDYPSMIIADNQGIEEAKRWTYVHDTPLICVIRSSKLARMITPDLANNCILIIADTRAEMPRRSSNNAGISSDESIIIPRVSNFENIWPDDHTSARSKYKQTGGSLSALHRLCNNNTAKSIPPWTKVTSTDRNFIWLALIGGWDEDYENDREIITEISKFSDYSYWQQFAHGLTLLENSPLERTSGQKKGYRLFSRIDAFLSIANKIEIEDIMKFLEMAKTVFLEEDGSYRPHNDGEMINRYVKRKYSDFLRTGIAEGIIFLSTQKEVLECGDISNLIRKLYDQIFEPKMAWHSLRDVLIELSEASPENYLRVLDDTLAEKPDRIEDLFKPRDTVISDIYYHPSLLWSLELLAWNPSRLSRVLKVLCTLESRFEYLIRNNFGNKPSSSMHGIFRSWLPQTAAIISERIDALEMLYASFPKETLNLCLNLADRRDRVGTHNCKPTWNDDALNILNVTVKERAEIIDKSIEIIISSIKNASLENETRYSAAYRAMIYFEFWHDSKIVCAQKAICALPKSKEVEDFTDRLYEHSRRLLADRISRKNSDDQITIRDALKNIESYFQSEDIIKNSAYLFTHHPRSPDITTDYRKDGKKWESEINELRSKSIKEIYDRFSDRGIFDLIRIVDSPSEISFILYNDYISKNNFPVENHLVELANTNIDPTRIQNYLIHIFGWHDNDKLDTPIALDAKVSIKIIENVIFAVERNGKEIENWEAIKTFFLHSIRLDQEEGREYIDELDDQIREKYFSEYRHRRGMEFWVDKESLEKENLPPENEWLAQHYLDNKQPILGWIVFQTPDFIPFDLRLKLLEAMLITGLDNSPEKISMLDGFWIEMFFDNAVKRTLSIEMEDRIAAVEFKFHSMLRMSDDKKSSFIQRKMGRSPETFIELVKIVFRRKDGIDDGPDTSKEVKEANAQVAYRIIDDINFISKDFPWVQEDGTLSKDELLAWIRSAQELAEKADRLEIVNLTIGGGLVHSYDQSGGMQPEPIICEILEEVQNSEIFSGFRTGRYNARGVLWGDKDEKGYTTSALAKAYDEAAIAARSQGYRFVAGIMENLAEGYRSDADRYRGDCERRDLEDR